MTEKEKMLAGEWFHPNDAELEQDRTRARHLTHRLNVTLKDKDATYLATAPGTLSGGRSMIRAPFYCDYGYNISIGKGPTSISTASFSTSGRFAWDNAV